MKRSVLIIFFVSISFLVFSKGKDNSRIKQGANANLVSSHQSIVPRCWINQFALIERWIAGMRPTVTSRALTYIHLAAYETALPGMPNFISNQTKMPGLKISEFKGAIEKVNWDIALNACYAKMDSVFLISAGYVRNATLTRLKDSLNGILKPQVTEDVFNQSVDWGLQVANAVWEYAKSDVEGRIQTMKSYPKEYKLTEGEGKWKGEIYGGYIPFTPEWGKVRTFTTFGSDLLSPPPPNRSLSKESEYFKSHMEVYEDWKNMDSDKRWRAEFWSDDIVNFTFGPSTRMIVIASQMAKNDKLDLEQELHLYCKLSIGLNDANVACWKSKYAYNTERPWQYIRENIDTNFQSIMGQSVDQSGKNPPFPAYPSGHSSCAGVSEIILTEFFGQNYVFTDSSHYGRTDFMSTPRTFNSIQEMAEEDAYSRIPMGAHVRFDCDEGVRLGRVIGKNVLNYKLNKY